MYRKIVQNKYSLAGDALGLTSFKIMSIIAGFVTSILLTLF